jgi:hypothetical protein
MNKIVAPRIGNCLNLETLNLTGCSNIDDSGLNGIITGNLLSSYLIGDI